MGGHDILRQGKEPKNIEQGISNDEVQEGRNTSRVTDRCIWIGD
jgi:hypothetical protein